MDSGRNPTVPAVVYLDAPTERQREQNRNRQRRYRQQKKANAAAAPDDQPIAYTGLEKRGSRLPQYSMENLKWMVTVGTCPSAGGARAPLSAILSHVAVEVSRWTVERYRWRAVSYMLEKQSELFRDFLRQEAVGVVLRFDETPMRLFIDGANCASVATVVRCVTALGPGGREFTMSPSLKQLASQNVEGLLGGLQIKDLKLEGMFRGDQRWRFLLVVADGAAVNRSVVRSVVADLEACPRVVVAFNVCSAHTLSNATKKSLGDFPYGSYLRVCHVLQARGIKNLDDHCARMLVDPDPNAQVERAWGNLNMAALWREFAEYVMGTRGPCADSRNVQFAADVAAKAFSIFPRGLPRPGCVWPNSADAAVPDYTSVIRQMFRRTVPLPVLTRWYTVERTAWYFLGMRTFSLFDHVFPVDLRMRYWPGDSPDVVFADPALYVEKCSSRLRRVATFVKSTEFGSSVLMCALSSVPRWEYADALNATAGIPATSLRGVAAAQEAFTAATLRMVNGENDLAEFLISNESANGGFARLSIYMALARAAAYLSWKNLPYSTKAWKMLRGEREMSNLVEDLSAASCCAASGFERKIALAFSSLSGDALEVSAQSLQVALRALSRTYTGRGGAESVEAERMFSLCRALGLKLPYRPLRPCTMQRELTLRFFLLEHKRWFARLVEDVYGSVQNMRSTLQRRPAKYNGFTAFLQSRHGFAADYDHIWAKLSDELKKKWSVVAKEMTDADAADRAALGDAIAGPPTKGPLESVDRTCPIDVTDVFQRLHSPGSRLAELWKHDAIRGWANRLDRAAEPRSLSISERQRIAAVLLPGDKCSWCRCVRVVALERYSDLRRIIRAEFASRDGRSVGLTIGLLLGAEVSWFEVVAIVEKPENFLAFPLDMIRERVGLFEGVGYCRFPIEARLEIGDVFDGRVLSLIDRLVADGSEDVKAALVCDKLGAVGGRGGWRILYKMGCDVRMITCAKVDMGVAGNDNTDDVATQVIRDNEPPAEGTARKRHRANPAADGLQQYMAVFNDVEVAGVQNNLFREHDAGVIDLDSESRDSYVAESDAHSVWADSEGSDDSNARAPGTDSDDELAQLVRVTNDDRRDISHRVRLAIDQNNYSVSVSDVKGTVTCFWKASEKNANRIKYRKAIREIRKHPGAKRLRASNSSLRSRHGFDDCIRRAQLWHEWHRAWLYDTKPSGPLPSSMPLPRWMDGGFRDPEVRRRGGSRGSSCSSGGAGSGSSCAAAEEASEHSTSEMESTSEGTDFGA